jgi:aspartyl protease family protein
MMRTQGIRLSGLLITGLLSLTMCTSGFAVDVNPPAVNDISEATAFFGQLASTSSNPVIADMAREALQRIREGDGAKHLLEDNTHKVTEVALVPQTDNTYVVPAVINKKFMATFLVDTGASYTVITPETASALGIQIDAENPTVPVTTANGTVEAPVVTLRNVSLGGLQVKEVQAVVTDLGDAPQLSGLLGMTFFQGMELSFKQDRLVISR